MYVYFCMTFSHRITPVLCEKGCRRQSSVFINATRWCYETDLLLVKVPMQTPGILIDLPNLLFGTSQ